MLLNFSGAKQEKTEWHRVVVWGKQAEMCGKYLSKGSKAFVTGEIETRSWDDDKGVKRYTTEIVAQSVRFVGGENKKESGPTNYADPEHLGINPNDDIPF